MKPNVLVVVIDALRADRVGAVGGRDLTPNIDELANNGATFTKAFSTTHATDPAVTSIMTGQYPLSHGITNHGKRVTDEEKRSVENTTQLPEVLSEAGYSTAKFGRPLGRWHRNGFDVYPETGEWRDAFDVDSNSTIKTQIAQTLEKIDPRLRRTVSRVYRAATDWSEPSTSDYDRANDRTNVLTQLSSFIDNNEQFFSFIHLMDTHAQYDAPLDKVEYCLENFEYENTPIESLLAELPDGSHIHDHLSNGYPIRNAADYWENTEYGFGTAVANAHYDAAVLEADDRVGSIINSLRERDILDDTLVIVLSDHGESLTEKGIYYSHHGLYESTVHVPLVIRPPEGNNSKCGELVQITDVAPTVASYAGLESLSRADGTNLRPTIENGKKVDRDFVMAEELYYQRRRMIRTDGKKAIYTIRENNMCKYCDIEHAPRKELYNLSDNSKERTNLYGEMPEEFNELQDQSEECAEMMKKKAVVGTGSGTEIEYKDEEAVYDRLEALGYR